MQKHLQCRRKAVPMADIPPCGSVGDWVDKLHVAGAAGMASEP